MYLQSLGFLDNNVAKYLLIFTFSYLVGSIPFAFIIAKRVKHIDIRYAGEGNVGSRNVLHTVGRFYGILVGILDFSKGISISLLCLWLELPLTITFIAGFFVILGHGFPIFLKFRGGKGAAAALGFLCGLFPLPTLSALLLSLILFSFRRRFHFAFGFGMASLPILWMPIFKNSLREILLTVILISLLGVKRVIDEPHMRSVKEESGWDKG